MNSETEKIKIVNTTINDFENVISLFQKAMELQGKNGYKVWKEIDKAGLKKDIENKLQYKILENNNVLCIFSIQFSDPLIWGKREKGDAIYLHRIVVNPKFKEQKQFKKVLSWTIQFARENNLKFVRMDTWADNSRIIEYYKTYGFEFLQNYKTTNDAELPVQNRNLEVALLEMKLED